MVKRRRSVDTWKQKQWFTVLTPKFLGEKEVGETPAMDSSQLINRVVDINVGAITGDFNLAYTKVKAKIYDVKGMTAYTKFDGFELLRDFVRMHIRRRRTLIRHVVDVSSKDNKRYRLSVVVVTSRRINSSQKKAIRDIITDFVSKKAGSMNSDDLVKALVFGTFIQDLTPLIKKIAVPTTVVVSKAKVLPVISDQDAA